MDQDKPLARIVGEELTRLKSAWPAGSWPKERTREYQDALVEVGDAVAIQAGVTRAIREWGGAFPPGVANLVEIIRAEQERAKPAARVAPVPETPGWWARLIQGTLYVSLERRGSRSEWPVAALAYMQIARRHELTPDDFTWGMERWAGGVDGMSPGHHSDRVSAAVAEARAVGEAGPADDGPKVADLVGGIG